MIYDKINNWKLYFQNPIFKNIFEELNNYNINTPNGEYKNNDYYYFKVMSYNAEKESTIIESHKKEVDIQMLLSGNEQIKLYDINLVKVIKEYDLITDCVFYI